MSSRRAWRRINFEAIFDGFNPTDFEDEVRKRWSETSAFQQSAERTKTYREAEWQAIKDELDAIWTDAAKAMQAGEAPTSEAAADIVERHRLHVSRCFYDLPPDHACQPC